MYTLYLDHYIWLCIFRLHYFTCIGCYLTYLTYLVELRKLAKMKTIILK